MTEAQPASVRMRANKLFTPVSGEDCNAELAWRVLYLCGAAAEFQKTHVDFARTLYKSSQMMVLMPQEVQMNMKTVQDVNLVLEGFQKLFAEVGYDKLLERVDSKSTAQRYIHGGKKIFDSLKAGDPMPTC